MVATASRVTKSTGQAAPAKVLPPARSFAKQPSVSGRKLVRLGQARSRVTSASFALPKEFRRPRRTDYFSPGAAPVLPHGDSVIALGQGQYRNAVASGRSLDTQQRPETTALRCRPQPAANELVVPPALPLHGSIGKVVSTHTLTRFDATSITSSGAPLPVAVRNPLSRTFSVDLTPIRVHTDASAQRVVRSLSTRAFAYGNHIFLGPGEQPTDLRLMAHEVAHVVQQSHSTTLQHFTPAAGDAFEREAEAASSAAVRGTPFTVRQRTSPRPQGLFGIDLSSLLDRLANLAANLPGFSLLTVIIGRNPINMRPVERNFTNLLRGFMGFVFGGEILFQILNRYGVVQRIGTWLNEQLDSLGLSYEYLRRRVTAFFGSLGLRDLISPQSVWQRAESIFTEPIRRIRTFVSRLVNQAITWLKETFLQPLSNFCREIPGYRLVTVLLGRDPFTNAPVERSALNVVRAFAEFIPGGTEKVNQLVESRALQRAYEWFTQETQARNLTWARVQGTFVQVWSSLRLEDVLSPIQTLRRIVDQVAPLMNDLASFARSALLKLAELIFEAVVGNRGARVIAIFRHVRTTFHTIINNPVAFLRNLVGAVGQGVRQFSTNILTHLRQGVITWLTGPVARAGIQMPERWDLRGVIWFVLQILGLTWDRIRQKLVRLMGDRVVAALETSFELIQQIRQRGLVQALRERIDEFFGQLREAALGSIRSFIQQRMVRIGIEQLLSLLTPVGAVIQAIMKTYTTIQFFIQRIDQIIELVESIVNSIATIAAGTLGPAASYIERTMARTIPVILDFLARFIGLGDVGGHVQRTIQGLQQRVDQMLDRAVEWIRTMAQRVVRGVRGAVAAITNWFRKRRAFVGADGRRHQIITDRVAGRPRVVVRSDEQELSTAILAARESRRTELEAKSAELMTALSADEHRAQREQLEARVETLLRDIGDGLADRDPRRFEQPETIPGPSGYPPRAKIMWANPLTDNPSSRTTTHPNEIRYRALIERIIRAGVRRVRRRGSRVEERHFGFFRSAHLIASSIFGPLSDSNLANSGAGLNDQMQRGPEINADALVRRGVALSYKTTVHYESNDLPPVDGSQILAGTRDQKRRWLGSLVARAFQVQVIALNAPGGRRELFNNRITDPPNWLDELFAGQGPATDDPEPDVGAGAGGRRDRVLAKARELAGSSRDLPSSREIGQPLGLHNTQVLRVLRDLEASGIIEPREDGGYRFK